MNFQRLRWKETLGEANSLSSSKECGLVLLESVCAIERVDPRYAFLDIVNESSSCRGEDRKTIEGIKKWESDPFYVSRFCRRTREEFAVKISR